MSTLADKKAVATPRPQKLTVEMNPEFAQASDILPTSDGARIAFTPPIGEKYWVARVKLSRYQSILAFPKFFTIGCGFAKEEDWNTNLPLSIPAAQIFAHIKHNKRYADIKDSDCVRAIELLQKTVLPILEARKAALLAAKGGK